MCSMWQIIRHANQAEAAVESLIMVWVPHKGTSPHRIDFPQAPLDSCSLPPSLPSPLFSRCPCSPRQTDGPEAEAGALRREQSLWRIGWNGWSWYLDKTKSLNEKCLSLCRYGSVGPLCFQGTLRYPKYLLLDFVFNEIQRFKSVLELLEPAGGQGHSQTTILM